MIVLLDADVLTYRCGFASQHKIWMYDKYTFECRVSKKQATEQLLTIGIEPHEDGWSFMHEVDPVEFALGRVKTQVQKIIEETGATSHKGFLSTPDDKTLFRNAIATTRPYKGNRENFERPVHYDAIRSYLLKYYNVEQVSTIEADDALAIHQNENTCIASIDKDLLQVPGKHYNFVKGEWRHILDLPAWGNLFTQVLTGDLADNIPGLFRIGPKKAEYILRECKTPREMYDRCVKAYELYSNRDDYMEYLQEQCQLLYLLRSYKDKWKIPN